MVMRPRDRAGGGPMQSQPRLGTERPHRRRCDPVSGVRLDLVRWPGATARLSVGDPEGNSRTLLNVATAWPGQFPHVGATVAALVQAGADVDARFRGLPAW
jgi:hypothetical protein